MSETLSVAGLFAGIGGIELGLSKAGHASRLLCECDSAAKRVLELRFDADVHSDIRTLRSLPKVDLVAAGFPCQDLSQAGRTAGIAGAQSGLVSELFRLLSGNRKGPRWLLLENVPFMLQLQRGRAMRYLVDQLETLGYRWAYRVVDARAFGVPQRRQRVLLLASKTEDPRPVLLGCDAEERMPRFSPKLLCGFYWTEGLRGLGWAVDAVPTLKGGSTIGIPSPPAIWDPEDGSITTPEIRDAERLQGFPADWTDVALEVKHVRAGHRWKLVGNAVNVSVAEWIGQRFSEADSDVPDGVLLKAGVAWPRAAWGSNGRVYMAPVSTWPVRRRSIGLRDFLSFERRPLSVRAAAGFLGRANISGLRFETGFLEAVARHVNQNGRTSAA